MGAEWGRKGRWAVADIVILGYALVPVLWIISLSFKPPSSIDDGRFIPAQLTWTNYEKIFQVAPFVSAL
ncbi:MAG: carbohydrate ABC transporter permease, partial [Pseudonocardiales bacterium]|nr:carbohydrate ABC transporter permease [Pseudonocardiales bacterium]